MFTAYINNLLVENVQHWNTSWSHPPVLWSVLQITPRANCRACAMRLYSIQIWTDRAQNNSEKNPLQQLFNVAFSEFAITRELLLESLYVGDNVNKLAQSTSASHLKILGKLSHFKTFVDFISFFSAYFLSLLWAKAGKGGYLFSERVDYKETLDLMTLHTQLQAFFEDPSLHWVLLILPKSTASPWCVQFCSP